MSYRNRTAQQHSFAVVPRADIPRSRFRMTQTRKQAFDASELIPIMVEEVLPGDTWQHNEHIMARLATPIAPAIDDIQLETFYFAIPMRLLWGGPAGYTDGEQANRNYWERFITGKDDDLVVPQMYAQADGEPPVANIPVGSVLDHMGIPPGDYSDVQLEFSWNAMPVWAYFWIWNEWFRDQNLQNPWSWNPNITTADYGSIMRGFDVWDAMPLRVNKRHDYFTSSLPWPQKGDAVTIPLGTTAPVIPTAPGAGPVMWNITDGISAGVFQKKAAPDENVYIDGNLGSASDLGWDNPNLIVDLSSSASATINALRLAFQTQRMLERDARGGSRYVEQLLAHFGVRSPDYRMQRPEYLGGSSIPITVNPIAQTAAYDAEPTNAASPVGNLGAEMHARGSKRTFTYAATEHCYIIGVACVRATPTYQQGIRRHWLRQTRLDWYWPVFSHLGEQAVQTKEIFVQHSEAYANETWGYQERSAEYRYTPNEITGVLRSTAPQPLDWWHYAEEFADEPSLSDQFIQDKTQETLARSLANAPTAQWSAQIIMDIRHDSQVARLMPAYSVPGLIDHF